MTEETTAVETTEEAKTTETTEDQRVPYERFQQANTKAKEAAERAKAAEDAVKELRARLEEREAEGLPELERERKAREAAERRAQEAEKAREDATAQVARAAAERLVIAAAKDFHDADDAVRNVTLDGIETADDAERAVKRVAKSKPHLLKGEEKPLPGKVLNNGQATPKAGAGGQGGINLTEEAQQVSDALKDFLASRK
jgi:hypothetical protein